MRIQLFICALLLGLSLATVGAQERQKSLATDPLLPLFNSFALVYEQHFQYRHGLVAGLWYSKATESYPKQISYPGHTQNFALIAGYRHYFWRNLHMEYQLYPGYTKFHLNSTNQDFHSFSLFNEFRLGYRFDFHIGKIPLLLNLQWPVGFTLYESNEPEPYTEIRKEDPVFYIFWPNFYIGYRF